MAFSAGGIDNNVASLAPVVDARGAMSRMQMSAGSDRDVIRWFVSTRLSAARMQRGLEGWVQVQFTITATGTVKDPIVVDAMPKSIFDDAALKAIARWRYNPKVENGTAVERVGVQTESFSNSSSELGVRRISPRKLERAMEQQANGSLRLVMTGVALAVSLALGGTALAQAPVTAKTRPMKARAESTPATATAARRAKRRPRRTKSTRRPARR
jgi:TonB family protein